MKRRFKIEAVVSLTVVLLFIVIMFILDSCGYNKQIIDLNYKFDKAYIENIGEIEIKNWNDYENSDMVQVIANDGTVYLTHSSNVILIKN